MVLKKMADITSSVINAYRVHIFVFLVAFFIGLTLAHPAIFLNDEFITTNQLHQLHKGHQIIVNEGKYGLAQNGTLGYFTPKQNILAYTLFLPMISMPAYWIIDITREQFAYFIIVVWTITALLLLLFINHFFRKFSYISRWQWTPAMVVAIFVAFFVNLYYYSPFSINPVDNYPEILAIVFTNIILLALSAMLMYEINRTLFEDPGFSFFGTLVCLSSSSYILWSTFCKDHILVLACFVPFVLCLVRFVKTDEYWYLPLAFLFSGLMAWARPEIAAWIFILVCGICGYTLIRYRRHNSPVYAPVMVFLSPLFTLIGALPFFLNNLLITKNMLIPVFSLYIRAGDGELVVNASQPLMPNTGINNLETILINQLPAISSSPVVALSDLAGIFFYPQTGNISIFAIVPLFLVMVLIIGIFLIRRKTRFSSEEKKFMALFLLIALTIFLAYVNSIHILNTDLGISPDIRYLSPIYLPLILAGLLLLKKTDILPENPADYITRLILVGGVGLVVLTILLPVAYAPSVVTPSPILIWSAIGKFFSIYTLAIVLLATGSILYSEFVKRKSLISEYLLYLLCSLPFLWQVNETLAIRSFSGFAGYIFWIPVIRVIYDWFFTIIFLRTLLP